MGREDSLILGLLIAGVMILALAAKTGATPTAPPSASSQSAEPNSFRAEFLRRAKSIDWQGIKIEAALAQSSWETGDAAKNSVFVNGKTNNLFNITKGSSWTGPVYRAPSGLDFRVYNSWEESMRDWVRLMHTNYYATALLKELSGDHAGFFKELKRLGYDATDKDYAAHLTTRYEEIV